jgi:hypothetical protein
LSASEAALRETARKLKTEESSRMAFQANVISLKTDLSKAVAAEEKQRYEATKAKAAAEKAEQRAAEADAATAAMKAELEEVCHGV